MKILNKKFLFLILLCSIILSQVLHFQSINSSTIDSITYSVTYIPSKVGVWYNYSINGSDFDNYGNKLDFDIKGNSNVSFIFEIEISSDSSSNVSVIWEYDNGSRNDDNSLKSILGLNRTVIPGEKFSCNLTLLTYHLANYDASFYNNLEINRIGTGQIFVNVGFYILDIGLNDDPGSFFPISYPSFGLLALLIPIILKKIR